MRHLVAVLAALPAMAAGRWHERRSEPRDQAHAQRHYSSPVPADQSPGSAYSAQFCTSCERDAKGRIRRSPAARQTFQATHPCPATGLPAGACPGYVVDHVIPLKRGGPDDPSNMQWQTVEEAKAKDRTE